MNGAERDHGPNLLAAYLEDRLDPSERMRLVEHLTTCAGCRGALALLARAAGDLVPLPAEPSSRAWRLPGGAWLPIAAMAAGATVLAVRSLSPPAPEIQDSPGTVASLPGPPIVGPSPALARPPSPTTARTPAPSPVVDESLLVKRGAERRVAGKTFRRVAGGWVDADVDPAAALPTLEVKGAEERAALLARLPALAPYAALDGRVVVAFEGTVYRFSP